jgi:uncharacterized protein (TIGR02757 family)
MSLEEVKEFLDLEVERRNREGELSFERPDPLIVAREWRDERVALVSALFAYGKAELILKFLQSLPFSLLDGDEKEIERELSKKYYRFQKGEDIVGLFLALQRVGNLEEIFLKGYRKEESILDGVASLVENLYKVHPHRSKGYTFLLGKSPDKRKVSGFSPLKRWNLFLRWMVREDSLDMGLWKGVKRRDLLVPLDTHTFNISQKLGLLERKTYDLKAVIELTEKLKEFDQEDPVKYDFAIYRVGQEKLL